VKVPKFNYAHFPQGTVCVVHISPPFSGDPGPKTHEVRNVVKNGPSSWVIETTTPSEHTGFFSCNIVHVTEIIKRGEGPMVFGNEREILRRKENAKWYERNIPTDRHKPKHSYMGYSVHEMAANIFNKYVDHNMLVDFGYLIKLLIERGVFRRIEREPHVFNPFVASKKKLDRALRQLVNKCLVKHKVRQKEEEKEYDRLYSEDLDREALDERFCLVSERDEEPDPDVRSLVNCPFASGEEHV